VKPLDGSTFEDISVDICPTEKVSSLKHRLHTEKQLYPPSVSELRMGGSPLDDEDTFHNQDVCEAAVLTLAVIEDIPQHKVRRNRPSCAPQICPPIMFLIDCDKVRIKMGADDGFFDMEVQGTIWDREVLREAVSRLISGSGLEWASHPELLDRRWQSGLTPASPRTRMDLSLPVSQMGWSEHTQGAGESGNDREIVIEILAPQVIQYRYVCSYCEAELLLDNYKGEFLPDIRTCWIMPTCWLGFSWGCFQCRKCGKTNQESDGGDFSHVCNDCHDKSRCGYQCRPGPSYMLWKFVGVVGDGVTEGDMSGGCFTGRALCAVPCTLAASTVPCF